MTLFKAAILAALLGVSGCAQMISAPPEEIARARYTDSESYISLYTMVEKGSGRGAHSGLIVSGSQVVLYDPAGTFKHPNLPERGDVFYGLTPQMKFVYESYHARSTTNVMEQKLPVTREFADLVIARMEAQGPSAKMFCAKNTSAILRDFPQFAHVPHSFRPSFVADAFGEVPGVEARWVEQEDDGQNIIALPTQ